jgi:signal transduction histidine kinase/DNA-binding response OmpR family regulator
LSDHPARWIDLGIQSTITLQGLDGGNHQVVVRGYNEYGVQSANDLHFDIRVIPFFFQRWWFYVLLAGLAAGGMLFWIRHLSAERRRLEREVTLRTAELRLDKETIETQAERLAGLDRLKSRFFANISHELRTPLTLILGPLKQARRQVTLSRDLSDSLDTAINNTATLQSLVNELLDLSKLEQGKMQLETSVVDLVRCIKSTTANFQSLMADRNIAFELLNTLGEKFNTILDRPKFEKIMNNLVSNAIKFTPAGGRITTMINKADSGVEVCVRDTGRGIPAEDIPQIFDRYFQSHDPQARAEGGTGIGLAMVREFTELMDGTITVSSTPGKGTEFILQFPFTEVAQVQENPLDEMDSMDDAAEEVFVTTPATGAGRSRILVVEDHPDLRTFIVRILASQYVVDQAHDGAHAWKLLETDTSAPDLILSDVMMPGMDGFELLRNVRRDDRFRLVPFCFLTARAGLEDKISALRLGVDDYLLKPFESEELHARIANLLQNARSRLQYVHEDDIGDDASNNLNNSILHIQEAALAHLTHPQFSIEFLAEIVQVPRRSLYRLILSETGLSPTGWLRELRLTTARALLEEQKVTSIQELSSALGFQKPKYFSQLFRERFGKPPSAYLVG